VAQHASLAGACDLVSQVTGPPAAVEGHRQQARPCCLGYDGFDVQPQPGREPDGLMPPCPPARRTGRILDHSYAGAAGNRLGVLDVCEEVIDHSRRQWHLDAEVDDTSASTDPTEMPHAQIVSRRTLRREGPKAGAFVAADLGSGSAVVLHIAKLRKELGG
jgi:hypothetical protein